MEKKLAQAYIAFMGLKAMNHSINCACGKTVKGAIMLHDSKTEEQYNAILALAEG